MKFTWDTGYGSPDFLLMARDSNLNLLFIVNRRSGTGSHAKLEALVRRVCDRKRAGYAFEYTRAPEHATTLARAGAGQGFHCIVAVGGDGTVNEVAAGLAGTPVPMAIVPAGSGNGLARHLGIPMDWEAAVRSIFSSDAMPIDTFTLNDRLSVNVSGIGFDGHVAGIFGVGRQRGLMSYAQIALREYRRFRMFQATLIPEGGTPLERNAFIIAIANSAQYGNNARIAPHSSVCDGKLNINVVAKIPLSRLDMVYALFRGDVTTSLWCEMHEIQNLTIQLDRPVRYHIDGEPHGDEHVFRIRINPLSLPVMIPRIRRGAV